MTEEFPENAQQFGKGFSEMAQLLLSSLLFVGILNKIKRDILYNLSSNSVDMHVI
jgi:hypothetical protein